MFGHIEPPRCRARGEFAEMNKRIEAGPRDPFIHVPSSRCIYFRQAISPLIYFRQVISPFMGAPADPHDASARTGITGCAPDGKRLRRTLELLQPEYELYPAPFLAAIGTHSLTYLLTYSLTYLLTAAARV